MFDFPPPDAATIEAMKAWAIAGAALGFGTLLPKWLAAHGWRGAPSEPTLHIPGAPGADKAAPAPWSAPGLGTATLGAFLGAMGAWGWYGGPSAQHAIGLAMACLGVPAALWQVLRVQRDGPAVGEPPPDDPDEAPSVLLFRALAGLGFAALGLVMAIFL